MVVFGAVEATGLASLIIAGVGGALAARAAYRNRGAGVGSKRLVAKLDDFEEREEINRLRHRDFGAFLAKLNARREAIGQPPLTREYLEPHQFNLMYSVDAGDIDDVELAKLRKRVGKAVKTGDAPEAGLASD